MLNRQTIDNKTLALAGIFQASYLVNQIAFNDFINGSLKNFTDDKNNHNAYKTSLESIFKLDAPDVKSIFGNNIQHLHAGLLLLKQFGTKETNANEKFLIRYFLYMTRFAKKILNDPALFKHLQRRLILIISQVEHLGSTHESVIQELGLLYRQVFGSRHLHIPVFGKLSGMKQSETVDKIYMLLIAGIRSGVLFYQLGGNLFELFFMRSRFRASASRLLEMRNY